MSKYNNECEEYEIKGNGDNNFYIPPRSQNNDSTIGQELNASNTNSRKRKRDNDEHNSQYNPSSSKKQRIENNHNKKDNNDLDDDEDDDLEIAENNNINIHNTKQINTNQVSDDLPQEQMANGTMKLSVSNNKDQQDKDPKQVTELDYNDESLKSIQNLNLSYYINLQELNLSQNQISKIEGLQKLVNLQTLDLWGNQISKIEGLQKLVNLQTLSLSDNQISKIEGLQKLVNLQTLDLSQSQINKIEELQKLVNLQTLDLSQNQINKIEGLEMLVNLQTLNLWGNQISKIEGLQKLVNLQTLDLWGNQISKIEGLETLVNLQTLNLSDNQISKIEGLETLVNLQILDFLENQINRIEELQKLVKLHTLNFEGNEISKIEGLQTLGNLQTLNLSYNYISKIEGLEKLYNLYTLDIRDNHMRQKTINAYVQDTVITKAFYLEEYNDHSNMLLGQNKQKLNKDFENLLNFKKILPQYENNPPLNVEVFKCTIWWAVHKSVYLHMIEEKELIAELNEAEKAVAKTEEYIKYTQSAVVNRYSKQYIDAFIPASIINLISNYFAVNDLCDKDLRHFNGIEDIDIKELWGEAGLSGSIGNDGSGLLDVD